jgi:hypothetical protein
MRPCWYNHLIQRLTLSIQQACSVGLGKLYISAVAADSRMNEVDADTNLEHLHKWLLDQQTERSCIGQVDGREQDEAQSEQGSC